MILPIMGFVTCSRARLPADEISGDLFDLLLGFGDFDEFKSLMLSYKDQFFPSAGSSSMC